MPWDASELEILAADLDKTTVELVTGLRGIMSKAGVKIKKRMRDEMNASAHFFPAAHTISYDITAISDDTVVLEVGPTHGKGDPGSLANIAYFGTSKGGGTVPDPLGALEDEAAVTITYIEALLGGLL